MAGPSRSTTSRWTAGPRSRRSRSSRCRHSFQATFRDAFLGRAESDGFDRLVLLAGLEPRDILVLRAGLANISSRSGIPLQPDAISRPRWRTSVTGGPGRTRSSTRRSIRRGRHDATPRWPRSSISWPRRSTRSPASTRTASCAPSSAWSRPRCARTVPRAGPGGARPPLVAQARPAPSCPTCRCRAPSRDLRALAPRRGRPPARPARSPAAASAGRDRREDFRTEVLGLMKAQMVKNAVIVPGGAKGGFVVKRRAREAGAEALHAEGSACYQRFIAGLLDVTDNVVGGDGHAAARQVLRHDGDDPYLVVAADKGTATFSDIANAARRRARGFWLGDAFASGGSDGLRPQGHGHHRPGRLGVACAATSASSASIADDATRSPWSASATCRATCSATGMLRSPAPPPGRRLRPPPRLPRPRPRPGGLASPSASGCSPCPRSSWADYDRALISDGRRRVRRARARRIALDAAGAAPALGVDADRR